ncbi:MAG: MotA/TolQ/ExbB proton channel family protein [Puniceicoccales bacterium]|jgi:biopolymer transport protein ExbB|nr:MotA/TolQ/ExbB proton channel family protein [Puniceicoccales bacterium]
MTLVQFLWIGHGLMGFMLLLGLLSLVFFLERFLFLHQGRLRTTSFIEGLRNMLQKNRLAEALTLCEETTHPIAHIAKTALVHLHHSSEERQQHTQASALLELPLYERRIGALSAIAKIAPLVGLLGTVLGFLDIFRHLEQVGAYAGVHAFAEPILSCILLSAAGLVIAVFSNLFYHFLYGRSRALIQEMEWAYLHLLQITNRYSGQEEPKAMEPYGDPKAAEAPEA